jgi:hypothetical protein
MASLPEIENARSLDPDNSDPAYALHAYVYVDASVLESAVESLRRIPEVESVVEPPRRGMPSGAGMLSR